MDGLQTRHRHLPAEAGDHFQRGPVGSVFLLPGLGLDPSDIPFLLPADLPVVFPRFQNNREAFPCAKKEFPKPEKEFPRVL